MKTARDSLARFSLNAGLWREKRRGSLRRSPDVASIWGVDLVDFSTIGWARASTADIGADELVLCLPPELLKRTDVTAHVARLVAERSDRMEAQWWTRRSQMLAWVQLQTGAATLAEESGLRLPNLAAAIVASHALALNVANFDPRWAGQHELLSAAAWLGVLLRGRPALMPPTIAKVFIDHRVTLPVDSQGHAWTGAEVLTLLAGLGSDIIITATRVVADGSARCLFPGKTFALPEPSRLASLRAAVRAQS